LVQGFIGPIDLTCRVIADHAVMAMQNFICGANEQGYHLKNANWPDTVSIEHADLRNIQEGDPSPDGKGTIQIKRGIEVGHIFQLGDKYSRELNAAVLDQNGKEAIMTMGCYGIGVSRVVAATIEQNFDGQGIIWPLSIAPFQLSLIPINITKSEVVKTFCETLYENLCNHGIEVLFDDRNLRPGMMFADHELIGIPHRLVVSEKGINAGHVEYKSRSSETSETINIDQIDVFLNGVITV